MIAADVNSSKSISTLDLIQLRKLILSIDLDFANNTSWRFVDKKYVFPVPSNPWAEEFPEIINVNDLAGAINDANFVAVKIGDINSTAFTSSLNGVEIRDLRGSFQFEVKDQPLKAGNEYTVDFKAADIASIQGYQATLTFDAKVLELVDVVEGVAKEENFGLRYVNEGVVTTSWNGIAKAEDVLFSLVFRAKADAELSNSLGISSRYTVAEAYTATNDLKDIAIQFSNGVIAGLDFELYQNVPNPVLNRTIIGFYLPEATRGNLTLQDASGRVLRTIRGDYTKGYNQVELRRNELPTSGVVYYSLEAGKYIGTKKMILLD